MAETFNDRLEKLVTQRLGEAIEDERNIMAAGGLKDYSDYRYRAGRIAGLRDAQGTLDQALSDIQKAK